MPKNPFQGAHWYAIGYASILTWIVVATIGAAASALWEPIIWAIWAVPLALGGAAAASYARAGRRTWPDAAGITMRAVGSFVIEAAIVLVIGGLFGPVASDGSSDSLSNTVVGIVGFGLILVGLALYALPLALAGAMVVHWSAARRSQYELL